MDISKPFTCLYSRPRRQSEPPIQRMSKPRKARAKAKAKPRATDSSTRGPQPGSNPWDLAKKPTHVGFHSHRQISGVLDSGNTGSDQEPHGILEPTWNCFHGRFRNLRTCQQHAQYNGSLDSQKMMLTLVPRFNHKYFKRVECLYALKVYRF